MTGTGAGPDRGLVPAVPEPLDGSARVRCRRRALCERRRWRQLQLRRLGPGRQPAQSVRRPARRRRGHSHAADRRGRRAAQSGSAHHRRSHQSGRRHPPRRSRDRRGLPDNPLAFSSDPNARRIIAHGFRNPFRLTVRPGTNEIWSGDVGWNTWEELNRVESAADGTADNYGWPCYEGIGRQSGLRRREPRPSARTSTPQGGVVAPHFAYNHNAKVVPGETCPTGSSSVVGGAFETGANFPPSTTAPSSSPTTAASASGSCARRRRASRPCDPPDARRRRERAGRRRVRA